MKNNNSNWSKVETKAYLLMYCIHTGYTATKHRFEYNRFNIEKSDFDKIYNEFYGDNDYQSIQKISTAIDNNNYSKDQIHSLFNDVKSIFILPKKKNKLVINNMFSNLERIVIKAA